MNNRQIYCLILWLFVTNNFITASTPKFLFTVPRNLWQSSSEEFCISFHDDEVADYSVSLSIAGKTYGLGNGTAAGEGKACHKFSVPDVAGNGELSLFMDSQDDEGIRDVRVESAKINIYESSLETFIQTDKPIYKPGETVKFRAMTVNNNFKPWIGMVPLVTIKNPSDVRVMQWKDVKNERGLLSFEMPLSADPTLGEWQITMIVEGKEHSQPFKVEEYVLPKYEVTITAPTFLLPTTDTIEGTVCAKYTYGKLVKGRVQLSVCFVDVSPYYYYYRYEQEERPCAVRIMDIDGCEKFSVEGSELELRSSNFSRYGNLVINATVTEQATGISLNGTVQGPEMTFEAVKMKFEDDTHGYFKEAFPYYARVIVTKPDGSPAPDEVIEISADNYDPDFHLKRNFTSDKNGVVTFAIKDLPKDVNSLSFSARAPKYFTPYGRYHYIIRMYEPRASHHAKKWYSPSNSYIHIPAVDKQLICGSVAEFDVLYSTPPDTNYKFFVQVLSKSHMVHHTHVRHHFKIHDAVNFDSISQDMLLDPFILPPRPTYYPIDPIPYYDDPELGYLPPADNVTIHFTDLMSNDTTGTNGEGRDSKEESCNLLAVLACAQPMREVGQQSVKEMCRAFNKFVECIEPHRDNCEDESNFKNLAVLESTYSTVCKDSDCDMMAASRCMEPMMKLTGQEKLEDLCEVYHESKECLEPHQKSCSSNPEALGSLVQIMQTYSTVCPDDEDNDDEDTVCDMVAVSRCMEPMMKFTGQEKPEDLCEVYQETKECLELHQESCSSNVQAMASVGPIIQTFDQVCPDDRNNEDNKDDEPETVCFDNYKPHYNATVELLPFDMVSASNTRTVQECALVCNRDEDCLGFVYYNDKSGTCELYNSKRNVVPAEGKDYYERNCYLKEKKDVMKSTHIGRVRIQIPVTANMGPESQLLVYYVREDEETVAATVTFKVERCFDNKVQMKFNKETVYPGNDVQFNLKAAPGSVCSVGVVDKSINLLAGSNQLTPERIFERFKVPYMYTSYWQDDKKYCDEKTQYDESLYSPDEYSYWRSYDFDAVDAIEAFRKMNLVVFTDLTLQTRPCSVKIQRPVYYDSRPFLGERPVMAYNGIRTRPAGAQIPNKRKDVTDNEIPESEATRFMGLPGPRPVPGPMGPNGEPGLQLGAISPGEITRDPPKQVGLRNEFPETWLWKLYVIGDEGEVNVDTTIPHTITEWVGNSLCTNVDKGVGVSSVTAITAFQPFFLSFTLPYSAVRGEVVPVLVTIFNYMSECLVMQVALPTTKDFGIDTGSSRSVLRCVCPGESSTIKYHVIPYTLGKIKILATAESIPDDGTCGNRVVSLDGTGANDAVERELLIEAEGIEKEYTATQYICPEGSEVEKEIILPLPSENLVDDSARGYINVIGDIMGPALSNLKDLLQMPYGCGEQNMASFSPNIVALQYLTNTNQLLPKIEEEAKGYMRIGYQRQLKYRHADGSYSAFGGDGSGSIWLTAFVVKCFGQSRPYISIDDKDLENSITWFRQKQLENGCFPKIGYTHSYYLKGGFSDRSNEGSLTAFVLIAMLEAGIPRTDPSVVNAIRCLDVQDIPDTYTLSMMAYAYTLYDVRHLRRQHVMRMLEERATTKDGMKFWARTAVKDENEKKKWYYSAVSAEVEMTAYALLAYITGEQENAALNARPIVMWLTKQRNPRGGFSSTQDTIIALQALSRYATLVYQGGVDVSVQVSERVRSGIISSTKFSINDDNTLVLQSEAINKLPSTMRIKVGGVGCAMVQANVKYNVYETPTSPTFDMKVNVYRAKDNVNQCSKRTINICVRFTGPGGVSNMAIVDIKMVTGWVPDEDSLKKLIVDKDHQAYIGIEKYEIEGSYVHLYFDKLDSQRRCFMVDVDQEIRVTSPKPAQVKVYDYYETDFSLINNYDIKTTCGTKEELPYISPEEYYSGLFVDIPVDEIVQRRIPPTLEGLSPPGVSTDAVLSCPRCNSTYDVKSKTFKEMVCGSNKIYKVLKGRKGDYSMKVYANIRTKKKEQIREFVEPKWNNACTCSQLTGKRGKILVFSTQDPLDLPKKTITFDSTTKVLTVTKEIEKGVWRLIKRNKC